MRFRFKCMCSIAIGLVMLLMSTIPIRSYSYQWCPLCRTVRETSKWCFLESVRVSPSCFSAWYQRRFSHTDCFWRGGVGALYNLYGSRLARGSPTKHPIWLLPPEVQEQFLRSASEDEIAQFQQWAEGTFDQQKDALIMLEPLLQTALEKSSDAEVQFWANAALGEIAFDEALSNAN